MPVLLGGIYYRSKRQQGPDRFVIEEAAVETDPENISANGADELRSYSAGLPTFYKRPSEILFLDGARS